MRVVRTGRSPTERDVALHLPTGIEVEDFTGVVSGQARPSTRKAPPISDWQVDALQHVLTDAGFDIRANVELRSGAQKTQRNSQTEVIQVQIDVKSDELAVILLEGEGGVFAWQQPDSKPVVLSPRRDASTTLTFTLSPGGSGDIKAGRRGVLSDWLADKLIKPVRVLVLKFFAQKTVELIVSRIEKGNPTGLVRLSGMDPSTWTPRGDELPAVGRQGTMQVLLLVHGTFSSTSGSFGALSTHASGREFLAAAYAKYDAVIGFDHKTLTEDAETNAQALAAALRMLPKGTIIDSLAFSRGGLVWRILAQELFAIDRPDIIFRNTVFVGCTNSGTHLAEPKNWDALIDLYTNVVMAGTRAVGVVTGSVAFAPMVNLAVKTLGEFMQLLAQIAISERKVPGLASMQPGGATITRLNQAGNPTLRLDAYRAITANFEPGSFNTDNGITKALAGFLADRMTDRLWKNEANDLVVDTASMTTFGQSAMLPASSVFAYADKDVIYHTIYFAQSRTCDRLTDWLGLPHGEERRRRAASVEPVSVRYSAKASGVSRKLRGESSAPSEPVAQAKPATPKPAPAPAAPAVTVSSVLPPRRKGDKPPVIETIAAAPDSAIASTRDALTPCHINASFPESPVVGETAELEVTLSLEDIVQKVGKIHINDTVAIEQWKPLTVKVRPKLNCYVEGIAEDQIPPPSKGSPQVLIFNLRGTGIGQAEVWVDVLQGARRLTRLILQPVFVAKGNQSASAVVDGVEEDPPLVDLRIMEEGSPDRWRLRFIARCDDLEINHEFVTRDFNIDKEAYVGELYASLESCWSTEDIVFEQLMQDIRAKGVQMYRALFPLELQHLIWKHRAAIGSFQVIANEPSIPWEVVHVVAPGVPVPLEGGVFLAELGLTRWMSNVGIAPARLRLRPGKAGYCIPRYHDERLNLAHVEEEARMLAELLGAVSIGDEIKPVLAALARSNGEDFDALHFACHGSTDYKQVWNAGLLLNVAGSTNTMQLSVSSVETYANLAVDGYRPLIFLNACQSGVTGRTLTGAGGLAQAFVQCGAGLFVGTLWSIGDSPALGFASQFYGQLKKGRSVSQALRTAREQAKGDLDTSWLAYTVYGHPYARVSL
ncbi:CHAT domain protein [compost metagenome]